MTGSPLRSIPGQLHPAGRARPAHAPYRRCRRAQPSAHPADHHPGHRRLRPPRATGPHVATQRPNTRYTAAHNHPYPPYPTRPRQHWPGRHRPRRRRTPRPRRRRRCGLELAGLDRGRWSHRHRPCDDSRPRRCPGCCAAPPPPSLPRQGHPLTNLPTRCNQVVTVRVSPAARRGGRAAVLGARCLPLRLAVFVSDPFHTPAPATSTAGHERHPAPPSAAVFGNVVAHPPRPVSVSIAADLVMVDTRRATRYPGSRVTTDLTGSVAAWVER